MLHMYAAVTESKADKARLTAQTKWEEFDARNWYCTMLQHVGNKRSSQIKMTKEWVDSTESELVAIGNEI